MELSLCSCGINDDGMSSLSGALTLCPNLKILELSQNLFGPIGGRELAKVIKATSSIESIFVLGCDAMNKDGATSLLQAVAKNQTVQTIFLPEMLESAVTPVPSDVARRIAWLPDVTTNKTVDLSGRKIAPKILGKYFVYGNYFDSKFLTYYKLLHKHVVLNSVTQSAFVLKLAVVE